MSDFRGLLVGAALALGFCGGCEAERAAPADGAPVGDVGGEDQGGDAAEDLTPDAADLVEEDAPEVERPAPGERVEVALEPWLVGGAGDGAVRIYQASSQEELLSGEVTQGRLGDWVLENERVRLVVEGDDRAIGPCPWGGNIVDAGVKLPGGGWGEDVTGEICLLVNVGRTLRPERYEVLRDGADGGAGVLAVTGRLELLDFIHIIGMALGRVPVELELPVDPDAELPLTVTFYYILRPGDQGARVVVALRNDSEGRVPVALSHLMNSGGAVSFFNPANERKGFGYKSLGVDSLQSTPLPFLAFQGERSGFAYVPEARPGLELGGLPLGGSYVAISGVAVSWLGATDILSGLLTPPRNFPRLPGVLDLGPGEQGQVMFWQLVGDGSLATMVDVAYGHLGVETAPVTGSVRVGDSPAEGALVSAVDGQGRAVNQARVGADGRFAMRAPLGMVSLQVSWRGRRVDEGAQALGAEGLERAIALPAVSGVRVSVRDPAGAPSPGRVTILCEGPCAEVPGSQLADVTLDPYGDGRARWVGFAGMDGEVVAELPPGAYRVSVSRGIEWSVWPPDAPTSGGAVVEVVEGEEVAVEAEIAQVVDSRGAISGDFHVHSVGSPDSPVPHLRRALGFLAEGVDVLVSTDHDVVADLNPAIEALGAGGEMVNVVGVELTTANYGHYNAFPMTLDPASRNGGAFDWAGGAGPGATPAEIFAALRAQPGEQVIQINHPEGAGTIGTLIADPLRGITLAPAERFRLSPTEVDPVTGDTGLWSDDFTAMEIMNGLGMGSVWMRWRWWLQMLGRGLKITGTAVTDTHRLLQEPNGTPRTFVFVPEGQDQVEGFDQEAFAVAVNNQRAIGTNGPFFRVSARGAQEEGAVGPGETLAVEGGGAVTVRVEYDLPEWLEVDRVDVYVNLRDAIMTEPGEASGEEVAPTLSVPVSLEEDARLEVVASGALEHRHRVGAVEVPLEVLEDSYVIVVLRGAGDVSPMFPMVYSSSVKPFGFSNPLFVDVDGGGYDHPPLAAEARKVAPAPAPRPSAPPLRGVEAWRSVLEGASHHGH